ncbi:MAG: hypothetical protein SGI99_01440 [Pseudomonadota bacterium]|nr:hypothetical protein [Pseudomonadota bacterium]
MLTWSACALISQTLPRGPIGHVPRADQVLRAAARPVQQQLPANFAEGIAAMVAAEEAPSMLDRLAPGLCFVILLIAGIATSGEFLLGLAHLLVDLGSGLGADRVPWSLLSTALLSLAAVGLSDRALHSRRC